jgi:hypothetical protein
MSEIHSIEREELMAYLDGELPASRAAEVAVHVQQCADCQRFAADLGGISQSLTAWQVESADTAVSARIAEALVEGSGSAAKPHWGPWPVWLRWALGVAAVLVVLTLRTPMLMRAPRGVAFAPQFRPTSAPAYQDRTPGPNARAVLARKPMVERRAELVLTAVEFEKARVALETIVRRHGGYTSALTVTTPNATARTLDATLRVPADQLDAVLTEIKTLARVEEESQSGEEVTEQYVDLEARLANARNTEKRLTDLLHERTGKLSDVLEVEQQLSRVRGEVEQMEAQRKNLTNLVEFATVNVKLTEDYKAPLGGASKSALTRIRNAAVEGCRSAAEGVIGAIMVLFSYGPGLAIWAVVLYFPVRIAWKKLRPRTAC